MKISEWNWKTNDDLGIYSKAWIPSKEAKGVVCLVHGVGEHIGRYQALGEALVGGEYILAGFDQRGFGKSEGRRGHTPSLDAYFADIDTFLREISQRYSDQPLFLYGMSMGAVLVLAYTPLHQPEVDGVIAVSPGLKTALEEQKLKVLLAKILGKILPTLTLHSGVDPQTLSRDPEVAEDFINDPLVHFLITTAWGKSMLGAVDLVYENAHSFPLPLLLMHGTKDELAYPHGSQIFAELAPKEKVTLKMWDGFMHDLNTDPESAEVFKTIIDWLGKQNRE